MNNKIKCSLMLAGLLASSASMAAVGDPVSGGVGAVHVTGGIITASCSVTIDSSQQTFQLTSSQISNAAPGTILANPDSTLTLKGCSGNFLTAKATAGKAGADNMTGAFNEESASVLGFQVGFGDKVGVTGGGGGTLHQIPVNGTAAPTPLSIIPSSDLYTLKMVTDVIRVGTGAVPEGLGALTGNYTYTISYQ